MYRSETRRKVYRRINEKFTNIERARSSALKTVVLLAFLSRFSGENAIDIDQDCWDGVTESIAARNKKSTEDININKLLCRMEWLDHFPVFFFFLFLVYIFM